MKHVGAVVAAALLVVLAIVVRREVIDGDDDGGSADPTRGGGDVVLACIPELAPVCEAVGGVEVRVEAPDATIAAVAAGEDVDAWMTFDPWPQFGEDSTGRDLFDEPSGVASSPLVIAVRTATAPPDCTQWLCLGESGAARRVVLAPRRSALELLVVGHAATGYFGSPSFASNDFDDAFRAWLGAFGPRSADPLDDMLVIGPASHVATGTTAVDAARIARSREAGSIATHPGEPPAHARVVLVAVRGGDGVPPAPTTALSELGWQGPGDVATGLPTAGVLVALRSLYEEVSR